MKTKLLLIIAAVMASVTARCDLLIHVQIDSSVWTGNTSEARSDDTPDSTTVRATLQNNFAKSRWEFRLSNYLTGSPDLTSGLDVTLGTEINAKFNLYGLGNSQSPQWIYVHGANVSNVQFQGIPSPGVSTFEIHFQPVMPTLSVSYAGGHTATAGIDFPYSGMSVDPSTINFAPPVISGNVICEDIGAAQDPSSTMLHGVAIGVSGMDGHQADFDFMYGSNFAASQGFDPMQAKAYLDWMTPASGFGFTDPSTPSYSVDLGDSGETYYTVHAFNVHFSTHDIQVGVFPEPLTFTGISLESTGVRLLWNADSNKTYTIESFETLGGATNVLGSNLTGPSFLDTDAFTDSQRFYRIREE